MTSDVVEAWLSFILTIISMLCLTATLVTYCLFSELRNLPGLNLMALATCILAYQLTFESGVNQRTASNHAACKAVAILIHFFILSSFFWTSVMAWDIYKTFGRKTIFSRVRSRRHFVRYLTCAFGAALLVVLVALLVEYSELIPGMDIGYGEYMCWIGNEWASALFLALPLSLVLASNVVLYVRTVASIRHVSKTVKSEVSSSSASSNSHLKNRGKKDLVLYVRIFAILGTIKRAPTVKIQ